MLPKHIASLKHPASEIERGLFQVDDKAHRENNCIIRRRRIDHSQGEPSMCRLLKFTVESWGTSPATALRTSSGYPRHFTKACPQMCDRRALQGHWTKSSVPRGSRTPDKSQ